MATVIAFDPGYGNTKLCFNQQTSIIQSAVVRPKSVGMAAMGMKSAAQVTQVQIGEHTFAVGNGAWHWGSVSTNLDYTALASAERRALFYAGLADLPLPGEICIDLLVIGLPVPLLQDELEAQRVLANLKNYKGGHEFKVNGKSYRASIERLKVMAQPAGAYGHWLFDENLRPRKAATQAEVAVLDIGMNTADLYAIQGGRVEPRYVGGSKVGVRRLLNILADDGRDLEELDAELRTGHLNPPQDALDSWMQEILAVVERTWPSLRRFSAVIPTGGGATVLGESLRLTLASKGAALFWPDDPVTANVIGLWKYATAGLSKEAHHAGDR